MHAVINVRRANHGLSRVCFGDCPDGTAERWSRYLAVNGAFYHQSMTEVLQKCDARYAGETLGRGTMAPRRLVRLWMQSPGHRDILLSRKARKIGIGATPERDWPVGGRRELRPLLTTVAAPQRGPPPW